MPPMSEREATPSDHAGKIEEATESRRCCALRETGGDGGVVPEGSFEGDGGIDERRVPRGRLVAVKPLVGGFVRAGGEIGKRWLAHDHSRSSAALAFYSIFSLVPLLVIMTKLASMLVGADAARAEISSASEIFLDEESVGYLLELVEQQSAPGWTGWMSLIAFVILLFTASKVVVELREVLSLIFGFKRREGRRGRIVDLVVKRGIPILLILSLGFVIAISALIGALFHLFTESFYSGYTEFAVWKLAEQLGSMIVLTLIFTSILRWLPPVPPTFRAAASGALVASLLLAGLRNLMNLYFEHAGVASVYGAAVALIVVLLWIYFSVQIFFLGAEAAGYFQRRWSGESDGAAAQEPQRVVQSAKALCEKH